MIPALAFRGPLGGRRRPAWEAELVPSKVTEPGETEHVERGAVPEQDSAKLVCDSAVLRLVDTKARRPSADGPRYPRDGHSDPAQSGS